MEVLKHRFHYFPFENFFPSEVRFQNGNGNGNGNGSGNGASAGDAGEATGDVGAVGAVGIGAEGLGAESESGFGLGFESESDFSEGVIGTDEGLAFAVTENDPLTQNISIFAPISQDITTELAALATHQAQLAAQIASEKGIAQTISSIVTTVVRAVCSYFGIPSFVSGPVSAVVGSQAAKPGMGLVALSKSFSPSLNQGLSFSVPSDESSVAPSYVAPPPGLVSVGIGGGDWLRIWKS